MNQPRPPHAPFQPAPFAPPAPPPPMRTDPGRCRACNAEILWVAMEKSGKPMPCDKQQRYGDGRRHLVTRHDLGGRVVGRLVVRAGPEVLGFEPHWGTCPNRPPKGTRDELPGHMDRCDLCGIEVRMLAMEDGSSVAVMPYPIGGNWGSPPPEWHGAGGDLIVLPRCPKRAARDGWEGGARLFENPPSTVEGYRPHRLDCPA